MRSYFANFVRVHWTSVSQIPNGVSFELAASILTAFVYSVYVTARLQESEPC